MNKKDLIDAIALIVIICGLAIYDGVLNAKNDLKQNRINELEQQVEEQYYLIDSLKQEV